MNRSDTLNPLSAWTLREVAAITGATLDARWGGRSFGPVSTDSRTVAPGQFFLALRGTKFDGHRYCEIARQRGAAGLIVDRLFEPAEALKNIPIFQVEDTLRAYGDLATERRRLWDGPVLAISGSAGKTTTRRLVADALRRHRRVLEPPRNFNNLIGVPATLLELEPDHEIAVLELGMNQPGELRRLTEIAAPSAALLTQISLTHVGMFQSVEELIEAKLDLFRSCPEGTPLAVNAGCPRTMAALGRVSGGHPVIKFLGEGPAVGDLPVDISIQHVTPLAPVGYRFDLCLPTDELKGLELHLFGRLHLQNVAAGAALLLAAGLPPEWIAPAVGDFRTEPLRGEMIRTRDLTLVLDCYNASPPSMLGALESLAEVPCAGRRVLVLADMLELGAHAKLAHQALLDPLCALAPALFFGLGPWCSEVAETLAAEGWEAAGFETRETLLAALRPRLQPGDLIFFKGSRGYALEQVAQALAPDAEIVAGENH